MRIVSAAVAAGISLLSVLGAARAADPSLLVSSPHGFNWQGFHAGVTGDYYVSGYTNLDVVAGVNFVPAENFLIGLGGGVGPYFDAVGGFASKSMAPGARA